MKIVVPEKVSPRGIAELKAQPGWTVVELPSTSAKDGSRARELADADGLIVRSAVKVTAELLEHAPALKVVGRAGVGVDNVDLEAATRKGVVVMNTPFGNSITTAEHAIALMFALARQLPEANAQTQSGKWPKNDFMGVEVTGKTLGLIGAGNIGSIVADRALGLRMKVIAYDPYVQAGRAAQMGVRLVDLDTHATRWVTPTDGLTHGLAMADHLPHTFVRFSPDGERIIATLLQMPVLAAPTITDGIAFDAEGGLWIGWTLAVTGTVLLPDGPTAAMVSDELDDRYRLTYEPTMAGRHAYRITSAGAAAGAEQGYVYAKESLTGAEALDAVQSALDPARREALDGAQLVPTTPSMVRGEDVPNPRQPETAGTSHRLVDHPPPDAS